jgi:hypothetical protein
MTCAQEQFFTLIIRVLMTRAYSPPHLLHTTSARFEADAKTLCAALTSAQYVLLLLMRASIDALLRTFPAADGEALAALERHNQLMMLIRRLNGDVISSLTTRVKALQRELLLRLAEPPAASALLRLLMTIVARPLVLSGQPVTPSDSAPGCAAQSVPPALLMLQVLDRCCARL